MNQTNYLIIIGSVMCLLVMILLGYLIFRGETILHHPLRYCAEYIGEDAVCTCSYTGNEGVSKTILFTKDSYSTGRFAPIG